MKEGIYYDMPFDEYQKIHAFSQSWAKLLEEAPSILKYEIDNPFGRRDTPAMKLGRAVHEAVLEPELFESMKNFAIKPKFGRTKDELAKKEEFEKANQGKTILDADEIEEAAGIAGAVLSTFTGTSILKDTKREVTLVWKDKETGVLCKCRIDAYNQSLGIVIDLKTMADPLDDFSLQRTIYTRKYHRQLAWYTNGLEALGEKPTTQLLICVQKKAPYPVRFACLRYEALVTGKVEMRDLLNLYAKCLKEDKWPGYPDEITTIGLPAYATIKDDQPVETFEEANV